jgi:hypothetical protein
MMTKDFKDPLNAFNANSVKYLIIGAHAFGVHAQPRTTKDLDLFIRSDETNAKAASGREQDLLDVKVLRKAEQAMKKK